MIKICIDIIKASYVTHKSGNNPDRILLTGVKVDAHAHLGGSTVANMTIALDSNERELFKQLSEKIETRIRSEIRE